MIMPSKIFIPTLTKPKSLHSLPCKSLLTNGGNPSLPKTHNILISTLQSFKQTKSLSITKMLHALILRSGLNPNLLISNLLLHRYSSSGSLLSALQLFNKMPTRDVVTWNTMISGFVGLGDFSTGFFFFQGMVRAGTRPTQSSFASVLVASTEISGFSKPQQLHCLSFKSGFSSDCCVGNALLKSYASLGEVDDLWKLSEEMCGLDGISVEILLMGCLQHKMLDDALGLFRYSRLIGVNLTPFTVSGLCANVECIGLGTQIHGYVVRLGLDTHVSVVNSLITMYSRSFSLEDANNLFDWFGLEERDIVTWNSLIGGFAYNGKGDAGLCLVQLLLSSGFEMTKSTFSSFLSCCAVTSVLDNARQAHALMVKLLRGFDQGSQNIILTMYCRSNSLKDATTAFEAMEMRDNVSFNMMMVLYKNHGSYGDCVATFFEARSRGIGIDEVMLSTVVHSCSKLAVFGLGEQIHGCVVRTGLEKVSHLKNSLLELYSHFGRIDDMERIFYEDCSGADTVSWNHMLMGYAHHGLCDKSVGIWKEMERRCVEPNEFSYSALLDICGRGNNLLLGEQIHACIQKKGLFFDTALMNSLITMYSACGIMEKALSVFEEITSPDSVSWNAMVSGYSQNRFAEQALKFYRLMNENGLETNHMTFASLCMSCSMLTELKMGSQFHCQAIKRAFESDLPVSNSLITMYAKCGDISNSSIIFQRMVYKDVITWNSIITALSHHGLGKEAIDAFRKMRSSAVSPNSVTFVGILSACSQAGLVSEACYYFNSMYKDHGIAPSEEHYACMVDLFCRAGKLAEAKGLIEAMPFLPCSLVWKTLLSACRLNGDAELGEVAAKKIMDLAPRDSAPYVLLSDLYASVGVRRKKSVVRRIMKDRGVKKEVAYSWILS